MTAIGEHFPGVAAAMTTRANLGLSLMPQSDDEKVFIAAMAGVPLSSRMKGNKLVFTTPPCGFYEANGKVHVVYCEH